MKKNSSLPVVVVGTGGVARSLVYSLKLNNIRIIGVITRGGREAEEYISKQGLVSISYGAAITEPCVCILSVPDRLVAEIAQKIALPEGSVMLHTAGSIDMSELKGSNVNYGVLYPLQTLHKLKQVSFKDITICIESNNLFTKRALTELANTLSDNVVEVSSNQRFMIHLAAVFACNFTNFMYSISENILKNSNLDFSLLHSLIKETTEKALNISPSLSQTGPAVRNDLNTINKHLSLLTDSEKHIYEVLTEIIRDKYGKK
ncbi:MAG TPA: DUF2520 domain-containing protein [Salinivirgaceae bacterium]|nr:DUF2520 domain-containing protein [Salinivirgaceae bacterium]HQA75868.1 DUF2520 domain-containing protein [Salinivirgaceae bacterium]